MNEHTQFDPNNDNRNTLPRFTPEAMRANYRIVNALQRFGRERGMTSAQLALGWLLQKASWIVPIPGTTKLSHLEENLHALDFCWNTLKFFERVIQELCKLEKVRLKGDFYSPEFNRKFRDENAAFSFEEDKNRKGHYHICVNDIPLVQWFRQKANEWRNGLGIVSTRQDKGLKM